MLTARNIMTTKVITVGKDMPVRELARLLGENRISGAPVLEDGKVVGVVTESDLIDQAKKVHVPTVFTLLDAVIYLENPERLQKELRKMAGVTVGEIYSGKVITVSGDTPLDEVATIMAEKGTHTLPVMEDGRMVGVIGKADVIRTLAGGLAR